MKIALIGYGKMGHMVEQVARARDHEIIGICRREVSQRIVSQSDVCIDFSHPDAVFHHVQAAVEMGRPMVIGTTGWYDQLEGVRSLVEKADIGVIYAPNFSLGVNLFYQLVHQAAKLFCGFSQYDLAAIEYHHRGKVDSPSGTALHLSHIFKQEGRDVPFSSVRCGSIPGEHTILIDSPFDTITLTHTARSRMGFAEGAVLAAEWIVGKRGFYTIDDMLKPVIAT